MKVDVPMESYAARLASFNATLSTQRKRASDAKGTKILKWPHAAPSIAQLARAGFFYKPAAANPDNATCFLCECNLDGWEEEDEPIEEHLKHSPNCGWANIASVEQAVENGERDLEDPSSERLANARIMTFGSMWPHEKKRGWVCKIQKMVDAGWYYCPTLESDDFVRCAYCNLSLDGWEPKDNPRDEHQRRSPECLFFSLSTSSSKAKTKSNKSRNSKASRISVQSVLSVASENSSFVENDVQDENIEPVVEVVKPTKGGKKGPKGKKAKAQILALNQDETQVGSSFVEPEDDDFEIKVAQPVASTAKSKKRKSVEMTQTTDISGRSAPKRRLTTARDSIASVSDTLEKPGEFVEMDVEMADLEVKSTTSKSNSKKPKKGGKKRGSSSVRKASSKSTASEASLRAGLPNDEDIDAALEEDLDRPLTDDGEDEELEVLKPPKARRLTRNKSGTTAIEASIAPTRRTTRNSTAIMDNSFPELQPVRPQLHQDDPQLLEDAQEPVLQPLPDSKTNKKSGTRKASAKQKPKTKDLRSEEKLPDDAAEKEKAVKPKQTRGRQPSQQKSIPSVRISNASKPEADMNPESKTMTSMAEGQALNNDSEQETDAETKTRPKRGKKPSAAKKAAGGKRTDPRSRNIEDVLPETAPDHSTVEPQDTIESKITNDTSKPDLYVAEVKKPTKKQSKAAKLGPRSKANKNVPKTSEVGEATDGIDGSQIERLEDVPPSPVVVSMHSTPQPVPSPQSSDAENQPPSSRPSQSRPPLSFESPSRSEVRIPLAVIATPSASPSRGNVSKLRSTFPWTAIDVDQMLHGTPDPEKKDGSFQIGAKKLTTPEKNLTVEEWVRHNADRGEAKLRNDCERLVGRFEDQGVRALKTLEGVICVD